MCSRPSDRDGRHLCSDCLMRLPLVPQTGCCSVCGRPVEGFEGEYVCDECRKTKPAFDRAASAMRFEGRARQMLLDFKFNRHLWLRDDFADLLEAAVRARFDVSSIDLVVPMPTTAAHRWDRGYNQCEPIARLLARRIGRRFDARSLVRVGKPLRQSSLSEDERRENATGTFAARRPRMVRGRTVLVVDDILTTGATMSDAARALKEGGASRVWAATLARSVRD